METIFDVTILGAGIAGLSAAIQLSRSGWKVLIVDKAAFPRDKVCGGFVGPENIPFLESHHLLKCLIKAGAQKVTHLVMTTAGGALVKVPIMLNGRHASGLGISRKILDWTLLKKAKAYGSKVIEHAAVTHVSENVIKKISLRNLRTQKKFLVSTRHLINATGVPRERSSNKKNGLLGVSAIFEDVRGMETNVVLHLINHGHLGINRFENNQTNVCYAVDHELIQSSGGSLEKVFEQFMNENLHLSRQLQGARRVSPWKGIYIPKIEKHAVFRSGMFHAGDAVATVHPIVGGGISSSILCGKLLGNLMASYRPSLLPVSDIRRQYNRLWDKHFRLRLHLSKWLGWASHHRMVADPLMQFLSYREDMLQSLFRLHHTPFRLEPVPR